MQGRVSLRLPLPEIPTVRIDDERTYVHKRKTDVLAARVENIETRARQLAESSIRDATLNAGILSRAKESVEHTPSVLVRSLGSDRVNITWSEHAPQR